MTICLKSDSILARLSGGKLCILIHTTDAPRVGVWRRPWLLEASYEGLRCESKWCADLRYQVTGMGSWHTAYRIVVALMRQSATYAPVTAAGFPATRTGNAGRPMSSSVSEQRRLGTHSS